jgi:hypothetical protein
MLTKIVSIYPGLAQKMGIAGSVKIEVLVAPNGAAKSTQILGGHPVLAGGCRGHSLVQVGGGHAQDEGNRNFQLPS